MVLVLTCYLTLQIKYKTLQFHLMRTITARKQMLKPDLKFKFPTSPFLCSNKIRKQKIETFHLF